MGRYLTGEEEEKMMDRFRASRGESEIHYDVLPDAKHDAMRKFESVHRSQWATEDLQASHTPETVHKTGDRKQGTKISRIKVSAGHVYFQTVWLENSVSSSMCFVPNI